MGANVFLISPAAISDETAGSRINPRAVSPPLGLLYIAASLREQGHSVELLDMNCEVVPTADDLAHRIPPELDLIGITSLTPTFQNVVEIARICKEARPSTPIVLGGYFATFCHDRILSKYRSFDYVVRGEGEATAQELMEELDRRRPKLSRVRGLTHRENGRIRVNEDRPTLEDLDTLPFPAYELVSHRKYGAFGGLRVTRGSLAGIVTSRGCPYACRFCSCSAFTHSIIRWRSPEKVVEELRLLRDHHGLEEFMVVDDIFTFKKDHVREICRRIGEEGLDIEWYCEGRVNQAEERLFREMSRAGCRAIYLGIESCVDRILKYYRKGITYEMAKDAATKARNARLDVIGSFILGAPDETLAEMWETVRKAEKLDLDFAKFNVLRIVLGMPIWDDLVQKGVIDEQTQWEQNIMGFDINPEIAFLDAQDLLRQFHRDFYLRGRFVAEQILRSLLYRKKQLALNAVRPRELLENLRETLYLN